MSVAGETISRQRLALWLAAVLAPLAALLWAYWPVLVRLFKDWQVSEEYSVGQLVPLAALYMLWHDRKRLAECQLRPFWWGGGLIFLGMAAWMFGLVFMYESAERYSIVLTVMGLVLLIAGKEVFRQAFWILVFLFLMVPLPGRIHNLISGPLQSLATSGAVFLLEVFGVRVVQQGNTMVLDGNVVIAVVEACSGLRMLTAFMVVASVLAYVVDRPRWQKIVLVASSILVGIACNLARLCITSVLYMVADSETAEKFFHDFAGLTMMPLAVLILVGELALMNRLVISEGAAPGKSRLGSSAHEGKDGKKQAEVVA